jgi:hypothetical protein
MHKSVTKTVAWVLGIGFLTLLVLVAVLVINFREKEKDTLVQQTASPDGKLVAELHRKTTPMHGGPDTLYVTVGQAAPLGDGYKVYERTYECDDFSAFRLKWDSLHQLTIAFSACDAGREQTKGIYGDFYYREQNKVWRSDIAWEDVKISYEDTKYVATH